MPRLAIVNMMIGFILLTFAGLGGSFIANDLTQGFLKDAAQVHNWQMTLLSSAHGHTNLFGMLHIVFGLTLPYSALPSKVLRWQTVGLGTGSFAMAVLMVLRAGFGPSDKLEALELLTGAGLSLALIALASHAAGLGLKLLKRA